jgi:SMODS-associated and fused to various effectors sensor domain/Taurine catabolism dioxygenase TauD, TfdA family
MSAERVILVTQPVLHPIDAATLPLDLEPARSDLVVERLMLDASHWVHHAIATEDWTEAERKTRSLFQSVLAPVLDRYPEAPLVYFGSAPIPATALLGFLVGTWRRIDARLRHHVRKDWAWTARSRPGPSVLVSGLPSSPTHVRGDVVVRVSTSFQVQAKDTGRIVPEPLADIDIQLEHLGMDALEQAEDLVAVADALGRALDSVANFCTGARRVHLFAAVPVGLAFMLGTRVTSTFHPPVQTYQFVKARVPSHYPAVLIGTAPSDEAIASKSLARRIRSSPIPEGGIMEPSLRADESDLRTSARINPWLQLHERHYLIEGPTQASVMDRVYEALTADGFCQIRLHGQEPTRERLRSFARDLGVPTSRQNDFFESDVKVIEPRVGVEPTTGDSRGDLGFHVDGQQHEKPPALLLFQYISQAGYGGQSRFLDFARIIHDLEPELRSRLLANMARPTAVTFTKGTDQRIAPYFTVNENHGVDCRIRFDEIAEPDARARDDHRVLAELLGDKRRVLRFTPKPGDIVIFDNRRVLHAREPVGGANQRQHHRMWIGEIHSGLRGKVMLGVRGLPLNALHSVQASNRAAA